ncbi:hypothetical protein NVP1232O_70 [Vibrio phage 1.232.O._10N.261.51.E11]|nr:hypothetical protein NVP1232O_70 [Vibrio phage 1.232.O._10N.261.51.E11]
MAKYRKGERVTLYTKYPELCGVTKVIQVVRNGDTYICPHCKEERRLTIKHVNQLGSVGYFLENMLAPRGCCHPFTGNVLKPAPKKAGLSLGKMITKMKAGNPHF